MEGQPAPPRQKSLGETSRHSFVTHEEHRTGYGRLIHPLAQELGMTYQEYLWCKDAKVSKEDMDQALGLWGLERPNLVLNFYGPSKANLLSHEMLKHPFLRKKVRDYQRAEASVQKFTKLGKRRNALTAEQLLLSADDVPLSDEQLREMMRKELEANLIEAFTALLAACEHTNSWIVMKYDDVELPDFFLHEALRRSTSRPVIIAMVDRNQFCTKQPAILASLANVKKLHIGEEKLLQQLPVTRVEVEVPGNELLHDDILWSDWVPPYATHYIFAESFEPYKDFGPTGDFYLSGGGRTQARLRESIATPEPCIVLLHTGKACDFFGTAVEALENVEAKRKSPTVHALLEKMNEDYPFWMRGDKLYDSIASDSIVDNASFVLNCYNKDPRRFKSSNVILNAWTMDPYTVLSRLSQSFCHHVDLANSLDGGGEEADEETIMMAWNMHETLSLNCAFYHRRINVLKVMSIVLAVLTTTLAVCLTFAGNNQSRLWAKNLPSNVTGNATQIVLVMSTNKSFNETFPSNGTANGTGNHDGNGDGSSYGTFGIVMIILPALASLATQCLSRFHYRTMWGTMYTTKTQIESAIYRYRTRTGIYAKDATHEATQKDSDDQDKVESSRKGVVGTREQFSKNITALYSVMMRFGLRDASLETARDSGWVLSRLVEENTASQTPIMQDLHGGTQYGTWSSVPSNMLSTQDVEAGGGTLYETWSNEKYCKLVGETYLLKRFVPKLEEFQKRAPLLAARLHAYESLILAFTLVSTVLATLNMTLWIPIPVAIAGGLASLMQFENLQGQVAALNTSIDELTEFMTRWASLSIMGKRAKKTFNEMVDVLEAAVLREANVYVAGSGYLRTKGSSGKDTKEDGAADEGADVTKKGKKRQSSKQSKK